MQINAKVVCSKLWSRFLPHLAPSYLEGFNGSALQDRIVALPDCGMDISMIVPQHGRRFEGNNINRFLDWIAKLPCGVDLLSQDNYDFSRISLAAKLA